MGSLRSLNREKPIVRIRYELFRSWTGLWECLDWKTVPESDIRKAKREAVSRVKEDRQCYSSSLYIPSEHEKVTVFRWNSRYWVMHSSVGLMKNEEREAKI